MKSITVFCAASSGVHEIYEKQANLQRVASRVSEGGHNIPIEVIERRYHRGIFNLFNLYLPVVNNWIVIDNMDTVPNIIAKGSKEEQVIKNSELWGVLLKQSKSYGK